jgi:D-sedoheptulose 7-phosphate isomerase
MTREEEMSALRAPIERYWSELATTLQSMPFHMVARVGEVLLDCYHRGGTVFVVGNGGSAATASHFACDLAKGTRVEGLPRFRVVPLTDNVPLLTAWGNDTSYDRIFAEQLENLVRPGDVVILISVSGNSPNVLAAARAADECGATTIAWTGRTGGVLRRLSDLTVRAPSDSVEQVEDAHLAIGHSVCVVLRQHLQHEAALALETEEEIAEPIKLFADGVS